MLARAAPLRARAAPTGRASTRRSVARAWGRNEGLGDPVKDHGNVKEIKNDVDFTLRLQEAADDGKLLVLQVSTKMVYPYVVELSKEWPDVLFAKIMGDASNETRALMKAWGVRAVPEFRFFLDEELAHSHTGANKEKLLAAVTEYAEKAKALV